MVSSFFSVSELRFFALHRDGEHRLVPHSRLPLPHCPLDLTFDPEGHLWVLMDCDDEPLQVYTHRQDCWEVHIITFAADASAHVILQMHHR